MSSMVRSESDGSLPTTSKKKLTDQSLGARLVRHCFKKKLFNDPIGPAKAYIMHEEFLKYGRSGFKARYYKERKKFKNKKLPPEQNEDELDRMITGINQDVKPKIRSGVSKVRDETENENEDSNDFPASGEGLPDILEDPYILKLPCQRSLWVDSEEKKRISYTVNLPSGIEPENVLYRVVNDGWCLQVEIRWPDAFMDAKQLLYGENVGSSTSKTLAHYFPKLQGYKSYMKSIKEKEDDPIDQVMSIVLPFQVETQLKSDMVIFKQLHNTTCRCVEINLVEVTTTYFVNRGSGSFKEL